MISDFRDIIAFDGDSAIVLGVASPGFICKTVDAGKTWTIGEAMA